jgi:DNA modification methylase
MFDIFGEPLTNRAFFGDCREIMRDLKAQGTRVQMCVTSPPYFGLRDYGHPGQLGLEKTPAEYVAALVEVFDDVRDLLADDGVLWLNLGDSYAGSGKGPAGNLGAKHNERHMEHIHSAIIPSGLKPKDLIGIPWRVAFALQAAGWYLRQDIIWHKPNPMPESVTDRCTKAHEYLFLLAKSERYFFDAAAIKEPASQADRVRSDKMGGNKGDDTHHSPGSLFTGSETRNRRSVWTITPKPYKGAHFATFPPALIEPCILAGSRPGDVVLDPFFGSGTTGEVCEQLGRRWIGIELNQDYEPLQQQRLNMAPPVDGVVIDGRRGA